MNKKPGFTITHLLIFIIIVSISSAIIVRQVQISGTKLKNQKILQTVRKYASALDKMAVREKRFSLRDLKTYCFGTYLPKNSEGHSCGIFLNNDEFATQIEQNNSLAQLFVDEVSASSKAPPRPAGIQWTNNPELQADLSPFIEGGTVPGQAIVINNYFHWRGISYQCMHISANERCMEYKMQWILQGPALDCGIKDAHPFWLDIPGFSTEVTACALQRKF